MWVNNVTSLKQIGNTKAGHILSEEHFSRWIPLGYAFDAHIPFAKWPRTLRSSREHCEMLRCSPGSLPASCCGTLPVAWALVCNHPRLSVQLGSLCVLVAIDPWERAALIFNLTNIWTRLTPPLQPFTSYFPRSDNQMISQDLLHQVIKGTFKDHLVTWVVNYIQCSNSDGDASHILDELDHR